MSFLSATSDTEKFIEGRKHRIATRLDLCEGPVVGCLILRCAQVALNSVGAAFTNFPSLQREANCASSRLRCCSHDMEIPYVVVDRLRYRVQFNAENAVVGTPRLRLGAPSGKVLVEERCHATRSCNFILGLALALIVPLPPSYRGSRQDGGDAAKRLYPSRPNLPCILVDRHNDRPESKLTGEPEPSQGGEGKPDNVHPIYRPHITSLVFGDVSLSGGTC